MVVAFKPFFLMGIFMMIGALVFLGCVLGWVFMHIPDFIDGSFLSKFYILDKVATYISNNFNWYDYLVGVGLSNTYDLIGIGGHNIGVILFFETGIIGCILYFAYFLTAFEEYYSYTSYNKKIISMFLLIFLLMGFSLGLYIFPVMILTIAILTQDRGKYV